MPKLGVPILVVHGDCDDIVPYKQGQEVAGLNERARLVSVKGASHNDLFASVHEGAVVGEIARFAYSSVAPEPASA